MDGTPDVGSEAEASRPGMTTVDAVYGARAHELLAIAQLNLNQAKADLEAELFRLRQPWWRRLLAWRP